MKKVFFLMVFAIIAVAGQGVALGHACCLPDDSCHAASADTCAANGGETFFGLTCEEVVCEPPGGGDECSPGYWKNHTEEWVGIYCAGADCVDLLTDLTSRGHGSGAVRHAASSFLNDAAEAATGTTPCTED